MSSPRHPPSSPRFIPKMEQHHYSWDEGSGGCGGGGGVLNTSISSGGKQLPGQHQTSVKAPIRASSSPLPYKCAKPPR